MSDTLVIIPAFNESEALPRSLAELRAACPDLDVVVIDDGSIDETTAVAAAAGVTVITLPYNLGIGGALRTGFLYATRHGYRRAVQYDADGQHDPALIGLLLKGLDDGADLIIGSRFASPDPEYSVSPARGGAMGLLRILVRLLTGERFTDTSSGFRGFSTAMLDFFSIHYPVEYMESVEALILAHGAGFVVREIPVRMGEREAGVPSNRRLRLVYHFLRVLVVMVVSKGALRRTSLPGSANTDGVER